MYFYFLPPSRPGLVGVTVVHGVGWLVVFGVVGQKFGKENVTLESEIDKSLEIIVLFPACVL